ncbi:MAG: acetyl esterase/lipase [Cryomorphaceae bacterium]|jgi:acetyl esterase/lipase
MYRTIVRSLICLNGIAESRGKKRNFTVERDLVYTPDNWPEEVHGDFYRPDIEGYIPVVLLVHGGGWADNDNRYHMVRKVDQLVRAGFAVFNVAYRLAPDYHFPAPVEDLLESVKWLKASQDRLGIDIQRLAFFGYSAGGHLAELAAMREMPEGVDLRAVVAGGTPHFMRLDPDFPLVQEFMGYPWQDDPDQYRDATPVDRVDENFPPVFIYHGAKDKLVPRQHVDKWQQRLTELNIQHEVHWVKGRGHIGTFLRPRDAVTRAIEFLRERLLPR